MDTHENRHLGRQIKETNAFSSKSLLLGILASLICTAIIPALGAGRIATLAGAGVSPVLVAVITTQGAGLARSAGIAALSAVALIVSIGGFTLPEAIAGHGSLTANGPGTFVDTKRSPTPTPTAPQPSKSPVTKPTVRPKATQPTKKHETPSTKQPVTGFKVPASLECPKTTVGESQSCNRAGLHNGGATTLQVSTSELRGEHAGDFVLTKKCDGTLKPDSGCSVRFRFQPTAAGVREAFVVVTVSPGAIAHRIRITGEAGDDVPPSPTPLPEPIPSAEPPTPGLEITPN